MKFLLGTKIGMTQVFDEDGVVTPVTIVQAGPCYVTQVKTEVTDGYEAVHFFSVFRAPVGDSFDWGTWVMGIERVDGRFYLAYLVHYRREI